LSAPAAFSIFSTFFYSRLMVKNVCSYNAVVSWTNNVDIFKLKKLLIPINVGNAHWIAVMVSMTGKHVQVYDPLPEEEDVFNEDAHQHFDHILRFLRDEHVNKKGGTALPEASNWRLALQDPQLPTQPNGCDCGVFVSAFMYFSALDLPFRRGSGHGPHLFAADLRLKVTRSIMKEKINF
jgi:Ulp1 family protease